jgi:hypothetical protein
MNTSLTGLVLAACLIASSAAFAQAPTTAPAGSTGQCKDGSYTSDATKKGSCAGHKGVKDWYGPAAVANPFGVSASAPAVTSTTTSTVPAPKAPASGAVTKAATSAPSTPSAPGGGPGQVWVNSSSKVYHCAGTKYYGKTKQGEYMTEAAAKAAGNHADHGKACSS